MMTMMMVRYKTMTKKKCNDVVLFSYSFVSLFIFYFLFLCFIRCVYVVYVSRKYNTQEMGIRCCIFKLVLRWNWLKENCFSFPFAKSVIEWALNCKEYSLFNLVKSRHLLIRFSFFLLYVRTLYPYHTVCVIFIWNL